MSAHTLTLLINTSFYLSASVGFIATAKKTDFTSESATNALQPTILGKVFVWMHLHLHCDHWKCHTLMSVFDHCNCTISWLEWRGWSFQQHNFVSYKLTTDWHATHYEGNFSSPALRWVPWFPDLLQEKVCLNMVWQPDLVFVHGAKVPGWHQGFSCVSQFVKTTKVSATKDCKYF